MFSVCVCVCWGVEGVGEERKKDDKGTFNHDGDLDKKNHQALLPCQTMDYIYIDYENNYKIQLHITMSNPLLM